MSSMHPNPSNENKPEVENPSDEEIAQVLISGIVFATSEDLDDSLKESKKKTEIWTLTSRLERWWVGKLRETAPSVHTSPSATARTILSEIVISSQATAKSNILKITNRFYTFQPEKNTTVQAFIKEYRRRYNELGEHSPITPEVSFHIKNLLLSQLSNLQPELSNRCLNSSSDDIIAECLQWTSDVGSKSSVKQNLKFTCNYCHKTGHKEIECRKKIIDRDENNKGNGDKNQKKILSLNKSSENLEYQLATGADFHVTPNINDFSTYSKSPQTVFVAGGSQISTTGKGDLLFPAFDGKTEILKGAIHLPLQKNRILSTSQLESQEYSLYWPPKYGDVELIRPNGTKCATFQRESGRLIWNPKTTTDLSNSQIHFIKRDWHSILGHPGERAQNAVLKLVGKYLEAFLPKVPVFPS
ncbi:hypothetical protein K3495_g3824 [Podosphaera aphanis]|nr:hypothetical protein K3495_g3824 [Podosphaera aphanis]